MRVTIHYFASLRDRRGLDSEQLQVPEGLSMAALYHQLFPPDQLPPPPPVLYVLDEQYVAADTPIPDGAELAFLPPLGGG